MIQDAFYGFLSAQAGITTLAGTRIFPLVIPQKVYSEATKQPCLVYSFDAKNRQKRFSGTDSLVASSVQVDCYATTYRQAQLLASAVRAVLLDYAGTWTGNTSPQVSHKVQKCFLENEIDLDDPEPGLYRVSQSWAIWYDEA